MGAKISKRYPPSLEIAAKVSKLLLNFLTDDPHETTFGMFEISKIEILMNFI